MKSFFRLEHFPWFYGWCFVNFCIFVKNHYGPKSSQKVSIAAVPPETLLNLAGLDNVLTGNAKIRGFELSEHDFLDPRKKGFVNFRKKL